MAKVPVHESSLSLQPTLVNPNTATRLGGEVVDVSQGISGMAEKIHDMNNTRQALKANIALASVDEQNWQMAATDPDLDKVGEKIRENSRKGIEAAAKNIDDPNARSTFVSEATLEMERKQLHTDQHIFSRQSDEVKTSLVENNDMLVEQYKNSADKNERMLIKGKSYSMTEDAIRKGYVHGASARQHLDTLWKKAAIEQVKDDAAVDANHTLAELQKGKDGLYSELSEHERKSLFSTVEKQVKKQGIEDNYIAEIAQNHTENMLLDKMADHSLTMQDVSNARLGIGMPPARPEFAKAAQQALEDPFPTGTFEEQYLKAVEVASDTSIPPEKARQEILKIRGLTPGEKVKITNWALRETDDGSKRSLNFLVNDGIKKNRQELLERSKEVDGLIKERRGEMNGLVRWFKDRFSDDKKKQTEILKQFIDKWHGAKKSGSMIKDQEIANQVSIEDLIKQRPEIAHYPKEGVVKYRPRDGKYYRFFPDRLPVEEKQ